MDTLFEYAAQGMFPFKDQKIRNSFIIELDRRCKTSWAAADNDDIRMQHLSFFRFHFHLLPLISRLHSELFL